MTPDFATTRDTLFGGRLVLEQPARRRGYRVNIDALFLAAFAAAGRAFPARHAVDLGAGVGGVGLSLLHLGAVRRLTMLEVDPDLAALAGANTEANGWGAEVDVVCHDLGRPLPVTLRACADVVLANPPYVPPGRGRAPASVRARARMGSLEIFVQAARVIAGRRARVCFVYPSIELTTLVTTFRGQGLEPKRLRFVHAGPEEPARVALVEAVAGKPGGLLIEPPLMETDRAKARSAEVEALLAR